MVTKSFYHSIDSQSYKYRKFRKLLKVISKIGSLEYRNFEKELCDNPIKVEELCKENKIYKYFQSQSAIERGKSSNRILNLGYKFCLLCETLENLEQHHIDGNYKNHTKNNLCWLCFTCHRKKSHYGRMFINEKIKNKLSNLVEEQKVDN